MRPTEPGKSGHMQDIGTVTFLKRGVNRWRRKTVKGRRRGRQTEEPKSDNDEIGTRIREDTEMDNRCKSQKEQIMKLKVGQ